MERNLNGPVARVTEVIRGRQWGGVSCARLCRSRGRRHGRDGTTHKGATTLGREGAAVQDKRWSQRELSARGAALWKNIVGAINKRGTRGGRLRSGWQQARPMKNCGSPRRMSKAGGNLASICRV